MSKTRVLDLKNAIMTYCLQSMAPPHESMSPVNLVSPVSLVSPGSLMSPCSESIESRESGEWGESSGSSEFIMSSESDDSEEPGYSSLGLLNSEAAALRQVQLRSYLLALVEKSR